MSVVTPSVSDMLISCRQASRILEEMAGVARQQSRQALPSGAAGCAVSAGGTLLYDEHAVRQLARWQPVDHATLLEACPGGVLVVRLGRGEEPASHDGWRALAEAFRLQPSLGFAAHLQVRAFLAAHGHLACVVAACGYPVLLADLVSFGDHGDQVELGLEQPGEWSRLLHHRRLVTGPGPRWLLLGAQPCLGRAARARERDEPVEAGRSTTWSRWA
jgi:hypothetical protein